MNYEKLKQSVTAFNTCWEVEHRAGNRMASKKSWEHHYGATHGLHVLHHCDNPWCVNPSHLFLGTHADNMNDKVNKGRANYRSNKFTDAQVDEIFRMREARHSVNDIGAAMGCDKRVIVRLLRRHNRYLPLTDRPD